MDTNTLLWGGFLLFMLICCGMMMRMMANRPADPDYEDERTRGLNPPTNNAEEVQNGNRSEEEKQ
ncbi:hypothetical protein [Alteromonas macleodii]|uniref:Lipoprotein n=1 Tax=Alteromonas macleodii TaxID=28108 RepID=A0AB36FMQ8_ALTMA|nr:hypothetical protein [Alteromonas macleodii]OES24449.1 putative lipoprotein [Alteromonas macleodii]OES25506.1 putative lipoprotein [Alteromonas macleodii]OES25809.1 putative lipoprotein [Alteromonas macleodii]OES38672.1 putative lipoprotein [Alteromonas macleodii]